MPTRWRLWALMSVSAALGSAQCAPPAAPLPPLTTVRIATGLPGMTFKPLGEALMAAYRKELPDLQFEVVETAGSVANLGHLQNGTAELGLALADVAYMGYNGHIAEVPGPTDRVRGLAVLHPSVVHLLVSKSSPVLSIAGLRRQRLGVGAPGSGTAVTSALLLEAFGVGPGEVAQQTLPFLDLASALNLGALDAGFVVAADPVAAVRDATEAGARLVGIEGDAVSRLRTTYPFLRPATIPGGTYPGHPLPVHTVRVDVLLLCRDGLDDELVHRLTAALFEVLPRLAETFSYLRTIDVRRAPATPIPLHPGAAWHYRETELSR